MSLVFLAGCGGAGNNSNDNNRTDGNQTGNETTNNEKNVTLTLYSTMLDDIEREAYAEVVSQFEEETGIKVDLNFPGDNYEDQLRVKMAADDLPDLFDTHGWAIQRYGEYTADLSDMEWVEHLDEAMNPILKDETGKIHALPLNQAKDGIMYNATMLDEYGIEVPSTVREWVQAMEQVKEKSGGEVTPLWIPGNNHYAFARILDRMSTPLLVTDDEHNFSESLLDGTFDWSNYTPLPELLLELQQKGLLNADALTANDAQLVDLMAQNKIAFVFVAGASLGPAVTEINPDIKVGNMPVPAFWDGDDPSWIGGERYTVAAYKDSEHLEEAKQFIEFMARPENMLKLADATQLTWVADKRKLPEGITGFANKITDMGLLFGLWFEPEMVNKMSRFYEQHPDWIIHVPGRSISHGRDQYILDFSRKEVVDAIYDMMADILSKAPVSYVKWDMNRYMTEIGSAELPAERQREVPHRYILGVYELYERLIAAFPHILFESCASGGARFDPGMIHYAPQVWTSDDTDAVERLKIQYGTSLVYPLSTMGAHVSAVPNHQVGRITSLQTRGDTALFGVFGYELDPTKLTPEEKDHIREQIKFYKEHRSLIQKGTFYRLISPFAKDGNLTAWMVVAEDGKKAIVGFYQVLYRPNPRFFQLKLRGLREDMKYEVSGLHETYYGDELMHVGLRLDESRPETERGDFYSKIFVIQAVE